MTDRSVSTETKITNGKNNTRFISSAQEAKDSYKAAAAAERQIILPDLALEFMLVCVRVVEHAA